MRDLFGAHIVRDLFGAHIVRDLWARTSCAINDKLHTMRTAPTIVLLLVACAAFAQAPTYKNVGNMSQLMIDIIYPASDAIFYIERDPPKTDVQWKAFRTQALMVAEAGNLLLLPGRNRNDEKWTADAKLMIDAGQAAYKAALAKDMPAIVALNDQLYQSCVQCHKDYRPDYGKNTPLAK